METRFQGQNLNVNVAIDWDAVRQMIKHAIAVYDADKTARADFALESAGAWKSDAAGFIHMSPRDVMGDGGL